MRMLRHVCVLSIRIAVGLAITLCCITTSASSQSAFYKVHLDFTRPLHATVEADLDAPDGSVFTARHAGGYAWWDYIKNLRQRRQDGSSVSLVAAGDGQWKLLAGTTGHARLSYDVDLSFTEKSES